MNLLAQAPFRPITRTRRSWDAPTISIQPCARLGKCTTFIFATFGTTVITLVLIVIAFQVQRLRMLARTIAKLDELLELLRDTKRELSPAESKQIEEELTEIRVRLLQDSSLKRPSR
jgi:low affinity Fe/Cu permease